MNLRWYQAEAVERAWDHIREKKTNPCIELPTGAGKSLVIARLLLDTVSWGGRAVLLAHRRELLEQTEDKLHRMASEQGRELDLGVYSAGLNRRDTSSGVILAGIQSVYNRSHEFGKIDVVLIDEAHLIPPDGDGMFRQFLQGLTLGNPKLFCVGLTATPYRLKTGEVCGPNQILSEIVYRVGVAELINQGYLCKLVSRATEYKQDTDGVTIRGGEWVQSELQEHIAADKARVVGAVHELLRLTADRHSCLIFACGVDHARMIRDELLGTTEAVGYVDGETALTLREEVLEAFREGSLKYLVNVDVLTTGFDAPNVDAVALLRPTLSPGLYYQMVGRGLRLHPSKSDCLVLDFAGNVERHGPIDQIEITAKDKPSGGEAVTKCCPRCHSIVALGVRFCQGCNYEWERAEQEVKHDTHASTAPVLASETWEEYQVQEVQYFIHSKRGADPDHPRTMRVEYIVSLVTSFREWVCVEHTGFAREKAQKWWAQRCAVPCPTTVEEAVHIALQGGLAEPTSILVDRSGEYPEIKKYNLGEIPHAETISTDHTGNDLVNEATKLFGGIPEDELPF